jgi:predicted KAP-like P-loop ATPase
LEVLPDFVKGQPAERSAVLAKALILAGDDLLNAERLRGRILPGQAWLFAGSLTASLRNLSPADRVGVLTTAIQESGAIGAIVWTVEILGGEHGKYGRNESEREPLITEQDVSLLERDALGKVRSAARLGSLRDAAQLINILTNWRRWTSVDEVQKWILIEARNPISLAGLLEGLLSEASENGRHLLRIDVQGLRHFIDPSLLIEAVRKLENKSELTDNQRIAVDRFIQSYDSHERSRDAL